MILYTFLSHISYFSARCAMTFHRGAVTHIENMNELKLLLGKAFSGQGGELENKN